MHRNPSVYSPDSGDLVDRSGLWLPALCHLPLFALLIRSGYWSSSLLALSRINIRA